MSNLTNLLAFAASGLSFLGFAALMGLPWLVGIGVEYAVFRWFFRLDLTDPTRLGEPIAQTETAPEPAVAPEAGSEVEIVPDEVASGVDATASGGQPAAVSAGREDPEGPPAAAPSAVGERRGGGVEDDVEESRPQPEAEPSVDPRAGAQPAAPVVAFVVLALTLAGFGVSGLVGVAPVRVAVAGATVLAARSIGRRKIGIVGLVRAASPLFCLFVFALGIVVAGVSGHGLGGAVAAILPTAPSLAGLLVTAVVAGVLANVVNNLPATLVMLTALGAAAGGGAHPGLVLAMLIGVNIGPNLTYVGSLATLLWRRVVAGRDAAPALAEFLRLGALTVPAGLVAAVLALWLGLRLGLG